MAKCKCRKAVKIVAIILVAIIGLTLLTGGAYIAYMSIQYYRVGDIDLTVDNNGVLELNNGDTYTIMTYNIGFGAYTHDFSFFMDSGVMLNGEEVTGTGSRAESKEVVISNTQGSISIAKEVNADFIFFQEVDEESTRSYKVNQYEMITDALGSSYSSSYASNFHSPYLFYPVFNPHGSVRSGIATYSKYQVASAQRKEFPVDDGFFQKFFDLDRCFAISRIPLDNGKELVLINLHMSAYDEGGLIRAQQFALLNSTLTAEYEAGNYVIAGGDWNHELADTDFPNGQYTPEWVAVLDTELLAEHYTVAAAVNVPTCRSTDMAYSEGVNYTAVLDGYAVSDNITFSVTNYDADFTYSDHNPSILTFSFN